MDSPEKVSIGRGVFINRGCVFEENGQVDVGENVQIGPNVIFATTNHRLGRMESEAGDIVVLPNVWIGANVSILQGVRLGPNVIVGGGVVVTKSFKDCTICGIPARVLERNEQVYAK